MSLIKVICKSVVLHVILHTSDDLQHHNTKSTSLVLGRQGYVEFLIPATVH